MKLVNKFGTIIIAISLLLMSCSQINTEADGVNSFKLESKESIRYLDYLKIVDKETGCKYLVIQNTIGDNHTMAVQMYDKDGMPLCVKK